MVSKLGSMLVTTRGDPRGGAGHPPWGRADSEPGTGAVQERLSGCSGQPVSGVPCGGGLSTTWLPRECEVPSEGGASPQPPLHPEGTLGHRASWRQLRHGPARLHKNLWTQRFPGQACVCARGSAQTGPPPVLSRPLGQGRSRRQGSPPQRASLCQPPGIRPACRQGPGCLCSAEKKFFSEKARVQGRGAGGEGNLRQAPPSARNQTQSSTPQPWDPDLS